MSKQGNIKISSENMMPIIKKWLYSDKDIFLREIIANGADAITKYKKLISIGEAHQSNEEYCIKVNLDKENKTLTVEDNGLGMTQDEVEKYITQIAFSGASDFLSKYEKTEGDGIIGHFGLGFYSAYMVSEKVEIFTKSYKDEPAVRWESDGNKTYIIEEIEKVDRGTKIVMHVFDEEKEFLEENTIKGLINKYCSFMPYNIYLNYKGDGTDKPLNNTCPLYLNNPKDCTDEDYKKFYTETFMDFNEPIFWVHLNMDYPFNLKGILYFPKVKNKVELERGKVKLYCNQVFIADNIKEVIPEFLMLLNGVIDCPDIPLNVSRSFLQNDRQVQKISKHVTKKVADKLISLFKEDREKFEKCWDDVANFVKFGCIKDNDFYDKIKDIIIYKNLEEQYKTINEFVDIAYKEDGKPATLYYSTDVKQQAQYVKLFKDANIDALQCDNFIDPHFISFIEYKTPDKIKFMRIDSDISSALKANDSTSDSALEEIFKEIINDEKLTVKTEALKSVETPAVLNVDEYMRRYSEMGQMYGMSEGEVAKTLIINTSNSVVAKIKNLEKDKQTFIVNYIYSLAKLAFRQLTTEEFSTFLQNNLTLLDNFTNK